KGYLKGKDSVFAAALLVEMVAYTGKTIKELVDEIQAKYGKLYSTSVDISLTPSQKTDLEGKLSDSSRWQLLEAKKVTTVDGVKIWFDEGWCLARLSGTEPLVRITAESEKKEQAEDYIQLVKNQLER